MALRKRGEFRYGDSQADLRRELQRYAKEGEGRIDHFADARCKCRGRTFRVLLDENEGAAVRMCTKCSHEHPIGDSDEYVDEADLQECACPCGNETFEVTVGVSLYADSDDVRWLYLGCRCPACGLAACYGDWKNEYLGYRDLLKRV